MQIWFQDSNNGGLISNASEELFTSREARRRMGHSHMSDGCLICDFSALAAPTVFAPCRLSAVLTDELFRLPLQ